jgi:hypothetical protein
MLLKVYCPAIPLNTIKYHTINTIKCAIFTKGPENVEKSWQNWLLCQWWSGGAEGLEYDNV